MFQERCWQELVYVLYNDIFIQIVIMKILFYMFTFFKKSKILINVLDLWFEEYFKVFFCLVLVIYKMRRIFVIFQRVFSFVD